MRRYAEAPLIAIRPRLAHPYGDFMQFSQLHLRRLAQGRALGQEATRLWWACLALADYENRIDADAADLSRFCDMQLSAVYRGLKVLKEQELIEPHPTRHRALRVNPLVAWKGSVKSLKDELRRIEQRAA